jgi:hypothetical protein
LDLTGDAAFLHAKGGPGKQAGNVVLLRCAGLKSGGGVPTEQKPKKASGAEKGVWLQKSVPPKNRPQKDFRAMVGLERTASPAKNVGEAKGYLFLKGRTTPTLYSFK